MYTFAVAGLHGGVLGEGTVLWGRQALLTIGRLPGLMFHRILWWGPSQELFKSTFRPGREPPQHKGALQDNAGGLEGGSTHNEAGVWGASVSRCGRRIRMKSLRHI